MTVAIHDLAGMVCRAGPMTDEEVRGQLAGITLLASSDLQRRICDVYKPRVWFELAYGDRKIFDFDPGPADRAARRDAWLGLVTEHPGAYLGHRWDVMKELVGLTPNEPWEPVCQTFAANGTQLARIRHDHSRSWIQRRLGNWFASSWSKTPLYRPWVYLVLSLCVLVQALRQRNRLAVAVLVSGLFYEASFFLLAAAPDYRYSHWMIVCCCLAIVTLIGQGLRSGLSVRASNSGH